MAEGRAFTTPSGTNGRCIGGRSTTISENSVRDRVARLTPLPPVAALRAFFDEIVERSVTDKQRRGCMLVNSALEMAPYDPEFQKLVADEMIFLESFFLRCIAEGQQDGTIISKRPAGELPRFC